MGCSSSSEKSGRNSARLIIKKPGAPKSEIKVVFLGDAGVGKSSIAQRYCYNKF
jgi:GTPase SAR1 family protein